MPILVARQQTSHVLSLLSISLQNIANTLFDTIGEIKGILKPTANWSPYIFTL